jgi:hypothetical protein
MLTLTNSLNIEGYTVFQDDGNGFLGIHSPGTEQKLRFYVLPEDPGIAKDANGQPIFSLIVYRHDEERLAADNTSKDVGGGILTFTVELGVPEAKFRLIKNKLRARAFGADASDPSLDLDVTLVPFLDGSVSVAVAGETGLEGAEAEFVKGAVGTGKVSGIGANRKAVMVKLTQAGAALMSQLESIRTLPINVQYDLTFEHRLLGVTMRVWCDINSSYTLIQTVVHNTDDYDDGYLGMSENHVRVDKITSVTETLTRNKTAGVEVIPATSEVEPETLASLEKFGFDMLNKEIEKALQASPPPAEIDRTYLESYISNFDNNFNFTLDRYMVLVRNFRPSANVSNVFRDGQFEDMVAFIDLRTDFFTFLKIPVRVNADFTKLPLDSVTVTITYARQRFGGGGREVVTESFNFLNGSTIQTFLAYANTLADLTYEWEATVHYKGSSEIYKFGEKRAKDEFLVIDVGTLGMIQVDLGLGLVNLDSFPTAKVSFRYHSTALGFTLERDFRLNKNEESAFWTEAVHETPKNGYEYKVDWLRKDGDILPGEWTRSTSTRLRIDAPVVDQLKVVVICSGNFKEGSDPIGQVAVSLVYRDPENEYTEEGQLVFTDDKQQQPWNVDLRNSQLRDYQYKYSIVYKDGLVRQVPENDGWLKGEPGFITVGEKYLLRVDVLPALQTYPDQAKIVQVDFTYTDPANNINERDSFIFTQADNVKKTWRVRGVSGGPKLYTYQISYFSTSGSVIALPPVTQEAEALVLPPAPKAAAAPGG